MLHHGNKLGPHMTESMDTDLDQVHSGFTHTHPDTQCQGSSYD